MLLDSPSSAGRRKAAAKKAAPKKGSGIHFNPKAKLDNTQVKDILPKRKRR